MSETKSTQMSTKLAAIRVLDHMYSKFGTDDSGNKVVLSFVTAAGCFVGRLREMPEDLFDENGFSLEGFIDESGKVDATILNALITDLRISNPDIDLLMDGHPLVLEDVSVYSGGLSKSNLIFKTKNITLFSDKIIGVFPIGENFESVE